MINFIFMRAWYKEYMKQSKCLPQTDLNMKRWFLDGGRWLGHRRAARGSHRRHGRQGEKPEQRGKKESMCDDDGGAFRRSRDSNVFVWLDDKNVNATTAGIRCGSTDRSHNSLLSKPVWPQTTHVSVPAHKCPPLIDIDPNCHHHLHGRIVKSFEG